MLYFLGKDIFRWMDQWRGVRPPHSGVRRGGHPHPELRRSADLGHSRGRQRKLIGSGVADHHAIFCRAIGLNALFATPPDANILGQDFLRCYHRYTDGAYRCAIWRETPHRTIGPANFSFALYASGEYSKIPELQWAEE